MGRGETTLTLEPRLGAMVHITRFSSNSNVTVIICQLVLTSIVAGSKGTREYLVDLRGG